MAATKARNPLAFRPRSVTLITSLVYLALAIALLVIHHVVPPAPAPPSGPTDMAVDLDEAWSDLQHLTAGFHPYNSHRNDEVHAWLVRRINEIVQSTAAVDGDQQQQQQPRAPQAFVFDDVYSNLTFASRGVGVYFEGMNVVVYIRGSEDDSHNWWEQEEPGHVPVSGGVLVNAHYDSVSTGYGATDDGMGVVSCLQLIRHFTQAQNAPRHGLVILLNDGEEDFLNGARVYSQHPMARFTRTFLNLEGAGAGGRAMLFRSSDSEVTDFYRAAEHPFGSVLSRDGFDVGLVRSQTDYVIFDGELGMRGLDLAFTEPRARYHTDQDDASHASIDSLWHMLSAAIATTHGLVSSDDDATLGPPSTGASSSRGSKAVWFDLFGRVFVVFRLHTLFAVSVTLLIVAPVTLLVTSIVLARADRMYLFCFSARPAESGGGGGGGGGGSTSSSTSGNRVPVHGFRGASRFVFILVIPSAVSVGLAYLLAKVNPFIVHSSQYAVWAMMLSAWLFLAWFVSRVADFARPSALHRAYTLTWMFLVMWVLSVVATTYENQSGLAGGYFIIFYFAGVFLATWISYLELFSLPRKSDYASSVLSYYHYYGSRSGSRLGRYSDGEDANEGDAHNDDNDNDNDNYNDNGHDSHDDEEPHESTSLLRGRRRTTFANYVRVAGDAAASSGPAADANVYGFEQPWSAHMAQWIWTLQFAVTGPVAVVLVGQVALMLTSTLHQIGQDGSSVLFVYVAMAVLTTLLLSPLLPFVHRLTHHVPVFLLLVFAGTLVYNLVAFPFSESSRLKLFFLQEVDLATGANRVSLTGVPPYVQRVAQGLPSARRGGRQRVSCDLSDDRVRVKCSWDGLAPDVTGTEGPGTPMSDWISLNITRLTTLSGPDSSSREPAVARFEISGKNTRACKLVFDDDDDNNNNNGRSAVSNFTVLGSATDPRFPYLSPDGTKEIRLWSRQWEHKWVVDVEWGGAGAGAGADGDDAATATATAAAKLSGRAVCLWSDDNQPGVIPALDEAKRFSPVWAAISKLADGLVEGSVAFEI